MSGGGERELPVPAGPEIQVDTWELRLPGVSYRGTPGDLGEEPPASWRQVWRQVHRHLMRLVSGLPRLLAEAVEGVTRLARSTIPREAAAKVEAAHAEAEFWEDALRRDRLALGDPRQRRRDARRAIEIKKNVR